MPATRSPATKRIFVTSSELRWIKFHEARHELTVEFVSGGIYRYDGVPRDIFTALLAAESKGTFFNANIRSNYAFERL
jgi:hypothetical protein